jgi:hypothetical protein
LGENHESRRGSPGFSCAWHSPRVPHAAWGVIALIALLAHIFRKRSGWARRGRRTILWSATDHQDEDLMEEETAEPEESREEPN